MNRIIFPMIAIGILWGLNAAFLWHIFRFYGFGIGRRFYIISVITSMIFPLAMILHRTMPNPFTRIIYIIGVFWLGVIFLGLFIGFAYDVIFFFWKGKNVLKGHIWILTMTLLTMYSYYNQASIVTRHIEIPVDGLKEEINIGYLSDIHIDGTHDISYLDHLIEKINKEDIDVVLINGDMVDGTSFEKHSFKNLDDIKVPVYITFGNHESYIGKEYALSLFKDLKAKVLQNETVSFRGLQILGIEDLMGTDMDYNEKRLEGILSKMRWDASAPSLMLLHEPIGPEIADSHGIDVQLAGHTHNGQIWPFNYIVKHYFPYVIGLHKVGNLTLYVGPGTGVWGPPMRLGSKSEMTIIRLSKK